MAPPDFTIHWLCGSYRLLANCLASLEMKMQTKDQGYAFSTKDADATPFSPSRPPGVHHRGDVHLAEALAPPGVHCLAQAANAQLAGLLRLHMDSPHHLIAPDEARDAMGCDDNE